METEPLPFPEPGIYPHMDEATYHRIPALSKSLVKKFMISPIDAWQSIYGERVIKKAFTFGSALHCYLLEGQAELDKRYGRAFPAADYPEALRTVEEIKEMLDVRGLPKSGKKAELIARLQEDCPSVQILDVLKAKHEEQNEGKEVLGSDQYEEIVSREWIREYFFKEATTDKNEVSFFWFDPVLKVNCKARLDNISFDGKATAQVLDIKSYTNTRENSVDRTAVNETINRKYYIDAEFYTRALLKTPRVFHGCETAPDWPEVTKATFFLLYIESGRKFPNTFATEIVLDNLGQTMISEIARANIIKAAFDLRKWQKSHGEKPWNTVHETISLMDEHIPAYLV